MPPNKEELRRIVHAQLDVILALMNEALRGEEARMASVAPVLARIGRGGKLPHWFQQLRGDRTLPNLDGKTIGSVVEMLFVAVLETSTFAGLNIPQLSVSPARGVDIPELDLGIKSPSTNFCTSEPFFSAYERLYGSEYDTLVLLTDYQEKKRMGPLRLQISQAKYLTKTQIADRQLCTLARKHRDFLLAEGESSAKRVFRFLAYVNQSDWRANYLLRVLDAVRDPKRAEALLAKSAADFDEKNRTRANKGQILILDSDLQALQKILSIQPLYVGVIDAVDNWVIDTFAEAARPPSSNEWNRLVASPLDGQIGMSFALQWRYNLKRIFDATEQEDGG